MIICEQFITSDGRTVTKFLTRNLWTVSNGKTTRKFYRVSDYLRYMTK
jgi:hypothetical protein